MYILEYGLLILGAAIAFIAQTFVSSSYSKYSKVANSKNLTGKDVARKILDKNGLKNVKVEEVDGYLTDHYDPTTKVVRLSKSIYEETSIAAVSVAAHECGHAVQDKVGYKPMRARNRIVPLVNFSSYAGYIAIVVGAALGMLNLVRIGIIAELVIVAFQVITLPVEINASRRGMNEIREENFLVDDEVKSAKTMLTAAASTYLASVVTALLQVFRLVLLYGRRNNN
ncbi:MAG: zinc metallopeptidase [Romboutsia sp.]|nr:zinc metallopeptidase [Romboutsia sp.]